MDLTGRTFGRLEVLDRWGTLDTFSAWRCRCVCGAEVRVRSKSLVSGETKSCGCYSREVSAENARALAQENAERREFLAHMVWIEREADALEVHAESGVNSGPE